MPSCAPASSRDSSLALRSAALAEALVAAASSSGFAARAINANSTATKNALEAISTTVIRATTQGLVIVAPVADVDGDVHRRRHSAFDRADLRGQPARWCRPFTEQVCGVCG